MTLQKKKTYKIITVYLSRAELLMLKKQALDNGLSVPNYLRKLILAKIEKARFALGKNGEAEK